MNKSYVLYHANCNDGLGAAWVAWTVLGNDAEYIPVQYGSSPPEVDDDSDVYIVDFSYPRDVLLELAGRVDKLVVLDHHKTVAEQLKGIESEVGNIEVVFDMAKCGAVIAWEYFHPAGKPGPRLLDFIQDRDLYTNKLWATELIAKGLPLYIKGDFRKLDNLAYHCDSSEVEFRKVLAMGEAISTFLANESEKVLSGLTGGLNFFGHQNVPVLNLAPFMASDTLHAVLEADVDRLYPFAVSYFDIPSEGKRIYQLRSTDDREDVGAIAKSYGGGGHRNAAGVCVPGPA